MLYKSVVKDIILNAKIVAYRVKKVAKKLKNKRKRAKKLTSKTHSKYPLFKNKESMSVGNEKKVKIEEVKKVFSVLGKIYKIKEEIRDIFETQTMGDEAFNRHKEQEPQGLTFLLSLATSLILPNPHFPQK